MTVADVPQLVVINIHRIPPPGDRALFGSYRVVLVCYLPQFSQVSKHDVSCSERKDKHMAMKEHGLYVIVRHRVNVEPHFLLTRCCSV